MTCKICKRTSCTESFHSIEAQELYDKYEESGSELSFDEWVEYEDGGE